MFWENILFLAELVEKIVTTHFCMVNIKLPPAAYLSIKVGN